MCGKEKGLGERWSGEGMEKESEFGTEGRGKETGENEVAEAEGI